jgi:chitinase
MGWVVNAMTWLLYCQGGDPVPIVQEARWMGAKNLCLHQDLIP